LVVVVVVGGLVVVVVLAAVVAVEREQTLQLKTPELLGWLYLKATANRDDA
jgi:hypothetical protein